MLSLLLRVLLVVLVGAVLVGIYIYYKKRQLPFLERLAEASLPVFTLLTLLLLLSFVVLNISSEGIYLWSAARLTPLIGLFYGYDLYYGSGNGPLLDTIYGPFAYLAYAPAALASSPTNVVLIGQAMAIVMGVVPLTLLFLREARRCDQSGYYTVLLGVIVFALLAFCTPPAVSHIPKFVAYMAFGVHADAPALALSMLACVCIYGHRTVPRKSSLILCATFATLAVWAKQTEVGIFVAIGVYLFVAFGRSALTRFSVFALVVGASISGLMLMAFGVRNTIFNMFIVPGSHPWYARGEAGNHVHITEMFSMTWLIFAIAIIAIALKLKNQRHTLRTQDSFAVSNPWVLFVLASICMVPTSILGAIKVGGAENSYHFAYYLAVLAALLLSSAGSRQCVFDSAGIKVGQSSIIPVYIIVMALSALSLPQLRWLTGVGRIYENTLEQAYVYAKRNPGTAFFPWMPLSTLLAEGRLYHYDYGLFDWQMAGFPPDAEAFREHVPPDMAYIFYSSSVPAPDRYKNRSPPAVQYSPECRFLGHGGPTTAYPANWWAFGCSR